MLPITLIAMMGTAILGWAFYEIVTDDQSEDTEDDPTLPDPVDDTVFDEIITGDQSEDTEDDPTLPDPVDDTVYGTEGDDSFSLEDGQTAFGYGGDDNFSGFHTDNVTVHGGTGNDIIRTNDESSVSGGEGDDDIRTGRDSTVEGGSGDDEIHSSSGSVVFGEEGNDTIAGLHSVQIDGGLGNDNISAFSNAILEGGAGNDTIEARSGSSISGGEGDDVLTNTNWRYSINDDGYVPSQLTGGAGNDILFSRGAAELDGGDGDDIIWLHSSNSALGTDPASLHASLAGGEGADLFTIGIDRLGAPDPSEPTVQIATITDFNPAEDQLALFVEGDNPDLTLTDYEVTTNQQGDYSDVTVGYSDGAHTEQIVIRLEGVTQLTNDQIQIAMIPAGAPGSATELIEALPDVRFLEPVEGTESSDSDISTETASYILAHGGNDAVIAEGETSFAVLGGGDDTFSSTSDLQIIQAGNGDDNIISEGESLRAFLGDGDDVLEYSGATVRIDGGEGDDQITFVSQGESEISNSIFGGYGNDTITFSGDDIVIHTEVYGDYDDAEDVVIAARNSGSANIRLDADQAVDQLTMSMGQEVWGVTGQDQVSVNVYPETLDRDPAVLQYFSTPSDFAEVTLNLPREVTGEITVSAEQEVLEEDGYTETYIYFSFSDNAGHEFIRIYAGGTLADDANDMITINRDVIYDETA
ncbi:hypothetical protein [Thalassovita sp.]|uniref:calcium-binding protein n=1 Tax=Thalassovita sp. TaxID=1979401 RepID=UPI002B272909|nr:hypothetical protein [Thalassovita sp.]